MSSPSLALSSPALSLSLGSEHLSAAAGSTHLSAPASAPSVQPEEAGVAVLLQPSPPAPLHPTAAAAAASWWSPGSPHSLARQPAGSSPLSRNWRRRPSSSPLSISRLEAESEAGAAEALSPISPMAAALSADEAGAAAGGFGITPESRQHAGGGAQRRHSSPFLSRDCSSVNVFCADRYSLWTQAPELEERACSSSALAGGSRLLHRAAGATAVGSATAWPRQPRFASSLEAAERGAWTPSPVPAAARGGGGRGLRGAFGVALRWVSDKLVSHPIELTPSDRGYSSCSPSPAASPQEVGSSSPSASRFFTPGSGDEAAGGAGARATAVAAGQGTAAAIGAASDATVCGGDKRLRRHLRYTSEEEEEEEGEMDCDASCGSESSCTAQPGAVPRSGTAVAPAAERLSMDRGHLVGLLPQGGSAAGSPARSSGGSTVDLAAEGSPTSSTAYETPSSCRSPPRSEEQYCSVAAAGGSRGSRRGL